MKTIFKITVLVLILVTSVSDIFAQNRTAPKKNTNQSFIHLNMSIAIDKNHPIGKAYDSYSVHYQVPGNAVTPMKQLSDGIGFIQEFENGSIIYHPSYGAHYLVKPAIDMWKSFGSEKGSFGYPKNVEVATPSGQFSGLEVKGFHSATFERGFIKNNSSFAFDSMELFEIHGLIYQKYLAITGQQRLGDVKSVESKMKDGTGRYNVFEKGWIYWHPNHGAQIVERNKLGFAHALNADVLGYPISEAQKLIQKANDPFNLNKNIITHRQKFQNGEIVFNETEDEIVVRDKSGNKLCPYYKTFEVSLDRIDPVINIECAGKVDVDFVDKNGNKTTKEVFKSDDKRKVFSSFTSYFLKKSKVNHIYNPATITLNSTNDQEPYIEIKGWINGMSPFTKKVKLSNIYQTGYVSVPVKRGPKVYANFVFKIEPKEDAKFVMLLLEPSTATNIKKPKDQMFEKVETPTFFFKVEDED